MITVHVRLELPAEEPDREKIANLLKVVADDIHQNTYERATWKADGAMLQYAIKSGQPPEESGTLLP